MRLAREVNVFCDWRRETPPGWRRDLPPGLMGYVRVLSEARGRVWVARSSRSCKAVARSGWMLRSGPPAFAGRSAVSLAVMMEVPVGRSRGPGPRA
jgi:hypothetical protein